MQEFLGKISSYNLFNHLFSGVLFVIMSEAFTPYSFVQQDLITSVSLYYFIGLVFSRIGSLIIEPILKFFSVIKFSSYSDFVVASKKDPRLDLLSEVNNMYRTIVSVCAGILSLKLYDLLRIGHMWTREHEIYLILIILLLLFLFAHRKQTGYLTKRIRANLHNHE